MAPDGSTNMKDRATPARGPPSRPVLKKGPWTSAEDTLLMEYVKKHGEGNWNAVQRNSGLLRCGKSCRLRWANHLRPNLKKGAFSGEEERLIVELHAKLGNKWARMAAQLPGRTDNEIKNYWNTRLKRRQRAGLPVYPQDVQQVQQRSHPSSSPSLSSLLASTQQDYQNYSSGPVSLFGRFRCQPSISPLQGQPSSSCLSNVSSSLRFLREDNGSLALATFSPSPSLIPFSFCNQGLGSNFPMPKIQNNALDFGIGSGPGTGYLFDQGGLVGSKGPGLPSIQSLPIPLATPASSSHTASDFMMGGTSIDGGDDYEVCPQISSGKSGLLEDLLGESHALTLVDKSVGPVVKGKFEGQLMCGFGQIGGSDCNLDENRAIDFGYGNIKTEDNNEGMDTSHSSIGTQKKASTESTNPVDDDILSLLDSFPLSVPVPDWYEGVVNESNTQLSNSKGKDVCLENQQDDHNWQAGSSLWNNMPSIY